MDKSKQRTSSNDVLLALEQFYDGEIPDYIVQAGETFLTITISGWQGTQTLEITIEDVVQYYLSQSDNTTSGIRTLANHSGDWRYIDTLAKEALEWFKSVNIETLRRESRRVGLEPQF